MNKIYSLLVTVALLLTLGCAGLVKAQPLSFLENPKFIHRSEPVLGLNQEELIEVLGSPSEIKELDCAVPFLVDPERPPIPAIGDTWIYEHQTETPDATTLDRKVVCVVNRHAVGEERIVSVLIGKIFYHRIETLLNSDLAEKAFRGQLDENSYEERIIPLPHTGPEYEI